MGSWNPLKVMHYVYLHSGVEIAILGTGSHLEVDTDVVPIYFKTPVASRSKVWVCGRSLVGILGSNHAGGMDVCP